jgi:hypothetical protein
MTIAMMILRMPVILRAGGRDAIRSLVRNDSFEDRGEFWNFEFDEIPDEIIIDVAVVMNQNVPLADDFSHGISGCSARVESEMLLAASPINSVARSTERRNPVSDS